MINIEKKLINTLSLAQRATKLASGELAVEKAIKTNKAKLVIIATDVSDGTKKNIQICHNIIKQNCIVF